MKQDEECKKPSAAQSWLLSFVPKMYRFGLVEQRFGEARDLTTT